MNVAQFRTILPEFANTTAYPDARIQFNIDLATNSLNPRVWGDRLDAGILYYAAHYTALAGPVITAAGGGASPNPPPGPTGLATGLVASKSVGGVSVSFDTSTGQTANGGVFNLTRYGQTYLTLLDSVSLGAFQL